MNQAPAPSLYNRQIFFVTGLRNAHAMESHAVQNLSRQVDRLDDYPDMQVAIRRHIEESKLQQTRLEEVLSRLGESHSSFKDVALGFVGNLMAIAHMPAADEVIKDIFANYAFEHFEIAAYRTLITVGEAIGDSQAVAAAKASLAEEERMAAWISDHLTPTTLQFMALAEGAAAPAHA